MRTTPEIKTHTRRAAGTLRQQAAGTKPEGRRNKVAGTPEGTLLCPFTLIYIQIYVEMYNKRAIPFGLWYGSFSKEF